MILIDNQKFACSACINGHRSSSCHHTDRPLFEIKKKGRPVTQCARCRELRKTRSYHSKCLCDKPVAPQNDNEVEESTEETPGSKRKKSSRTAPTVPSLPNGIRDILETKKANDTEQKEESRKRFKAMLNPCKCGCDDAKRCRCNGGDLLGPIQDQVQDGSCCTKTSTSAETERRASPSHRLLPKPKKSIATPANKHQPVQTTGPTSGSCCAPKTSQSEQSSSLHDAPIFIKPLSLPPDSTGPSLLPSIATWSTPASIPTLHRHATTTMDSCGCGEGCACAGCVEHRGAVAAAAAIAAGHHSCPDRCGTCQDVSSANMRVSSLAGPSVFDDNSIESLLARAIAKLPPPPPGQLSVFQSQSGGERVALVVLPRPDNSSSTASVSRSCCAPATVVGNNSLVPSLPLPQNLLKQTTGRRRQARSSSPSDDGLTDADAEGESDSGEPEIPIAGLSNKQTKSWAYAQLDIDVDLELGLAADAIGK
ncbi:Metal-binding regulatory protein cuf1 OS=Schizosaccharomyces pombe (strain 972 / ATCC 24843) GN=cuf1 PE=1 SV=1 [Rhizoctonia solani AG-1 IB]|uniref:Metal-binding regulatory protein cuf1 n=1 Tax=Thanatephorus cucumeris (strain AG1-IB / isolate 7/3/14) TaxID=1108050 RepID=M5BLV5_THACB|nr:Metal-binding regulatory protein cuf1 [Rhizoctonia solani AG-1 IB]CEL58246.1 Metal-binding regulatory protein cuf1 OS=Schizosaccharomyces pombe (strain 972 / ATCC 24843) GN=cuf1 PE=1 SV=1 [Rhizoctonia solani AG-1 IB]